MTEILVVEGGGVLGGSGTPDGPFAPASAAVPTGGLAGEVLTKVTNADYDIDWIDPPQEVPDGGATGEVLTKLSAADGDVGWVEVLTTPTEEVPSLGAYALNPNGNLWTILGSTGYPVTALFQWQGEDYTGINTYVWPVYVTRNAVPGLSRMSFYLGTIGGATNTFKFALYSNQVVDGKMLPDALIQEWTSSAIVASSVQICNISPAINLERGFYWLAGCQVGNNATQIYSASRTESPLLGFSTTPATSNFFSDWRAGYTSTNHLLASDAFPATMEVDTADFTKTVFFLPRLAFASPA